jgi:hypothetical protein
MFAALFSLGLISRHPRDRIISGPSSTVFVSDRIRHFECYSLVRIVSAELAAQDDTDLIGSLTEHCQKLPDLQKDVCNDVISKKLPEIRVLLQQKKRPDQVCDAIGYNRSFSSGQTVSKRFCGIIVNKLRNSVHNSKFRPWRNRLRSRSQIAALPTLADDPRPQVLEVGAGGLLRSSDHGTGTSESRNSLSESRRGTSELGHRTSRDGHARSEVGLVGTGKRSGLGSFRHFFAARFYGRAVCQAEDLTPQERMSCHTITRFVMRGLHEELVTGINSTYICEQLEERHLVTFSDARKSGTEDGGTAVKTPKGEAEAPAKKPEAEAEAPAKKPKAEAEAPAKKAEGEAEAPAKKPEAEAKAPAVRPEAGAQAPAEKAEN